MVLAERFPGVAQPSFYASFQDLAQRNNLARVVRGVRQGREDLEVASLLWDLHHPNTNPRTMRISDGNSHYKTVQFQSSKVVCGPSFISVCSTQPSGMTALQI